jgi:hypothetical protein
LQLLAVSWLRELLNGFHMLEEWLCPSGCDAMAQEVNGSVVQLALFQVQHQPIQQQSLKNLVQMKAMLLRSTAANQYVVEKDESKI